MLHSPLLLACVLMGVVMVGVAGAAQRVAVRADVPKGLEAYSGTQPVTFGVPFAPGVLAVGDGLQVVDEKGAAVPSQFEVTATWTREGKHVRWLLIDTVARIERGRAAPLTLTFGPDVAKPAATGALKIQQGNQRVIIDTGARVFEFDRSGGNVGRFLLRDGEGKIYDDTRGDWTIEVERRGPVRAVVKITGDYAAADGTRIAQHITRYRVYAGERFARAYHTMIWLTDDNTRIGELTFGAAEAIEGAQIAAGLDGRRVNAEANAALTLRQADWDRVTGAAEGEQLDGWIEARRGQRSLFAALRWPWQQHPTALAGDARGRISVRLIGPDEPMSLKPKDVAVAPVMHAVERWNLRTFRTGAPGTDMVANGPDALPTISPRGVAKTWEMLLWFDDTAVATEHKHVLAQHPVLAFADPAFAVQAALPSPAAAYNPKRFPEIEDGLQRAFDWFTREQAEYGDFGTWNFGDIQWNFRSDGGVPIYRYWNNNGKGWSVLPWALWLRSGDRRYWEHGEKNSRHVMDVDTCHVPEWERSSDYKIRGGQYHYSALHWGYGPQIFTFYIDSEYLPYCWYATGYERAQDVMLEHAEAMARWEDRQGWMEHFRKDVQRNIGRHLYAMIKNLGALYEATWDPRLKELGEECLALALAGQFDDGNFPHVKSNHYLDQALAVGARAFGKERVVPAIKRWVDCLGDPYRPGPTGLTYGPMAAWSSVLVHEHTGDKFYIESAARVARAQVMTLVDGPTEWNGMSSIPAHLAGPTLRDWPILLSVLDQWPDEQQPRDYMPVTGFHSRRPVPVEQQQAGWSKLRHVALVLKEQDKPVQIGLNFEALPSEYRLRITAPSGKVAHDFTGKLEPRALSFAATPIAVPLPADGETGVYLIEIDAAGADAFAPVLALRSSTGKLVHLMGPGQVTLKATQTAGQFFFKPQAGATVALHYPMNRELSGRYALLDPQGKIVATSVVDQTKPVRLGPNPRHFAAGMPWGPTFKWQAPPTIDGLYSAIIASDHSLHRWIEVHGVEPYVAAIAEQWFDPTKHRAPHLSAYLD